ncbi:MAG: DUF6732 family protein [Paracoccaceae bacterium]
MKALPFLFVLFAAGAAQAHPGHLVDAAGHNHWVAGAAIGAAIAMGLWGALKGRRKGGEATGDAAGSEDRQGA